MECIAHAQFTSFCFHAWLGATILYLSLVFQSRAILRGKKRNSTDRLTSSSKKRKATNSIVKNCPTRRATHARACSGEDAEE